MAAGVLDGGVEQLGEGGPHGLISRVAGQLDVVEHPKGHAWAPADDLHLEPVALHIDACGQHGHAGGDVAAPVLTPRHQRIGRNRVARLVLP